MGISGDPLCTVVHPPYGPSSPSISDSSKEHKALIKKDSEKIIVVDGLYFVGHGISEEPTLAASNLLRLSMKI